MDKILQTAQSLLQTEFSEPQLREFDSMLIEYNSLNEFPPIKYGTAGFRDKAEKLLLIAFRIGIYMGYAAKNSKTLGIQISASHNPVQDNGIKLVGEDGNMFDLT